MDIRILEIDRARMLMNEGWPTHIISLISPHVLMESSGEHHLIVRMDDICSLEFPGCPRYEQIGEILEFSKNLTKDDRLLVHCHVGQSRSPAAAIAICIQHGMSATEAFAHIKQIRPVMMPNYLMISFIDRTFGLNGELTKIAANHASEESAKTMQRLQSEQSKESIDDMRNIMSINLNLFED